MENEVKKLYRSKKGRVLAGICGGLGEYFKVDPVIFRILFAFFFFAGGATLILYIILIFVIPLKGKKKK